MNVQYYLIDVNKIKDVLEKETQLDSNRMKWSLDLLVFNIEHNLFSILNNSKLLIELDHDAKKASLMWEDFDSSKWKVIYDKEVNNETIYNSIVDAIRESNQTNWWDDMIKEIQAKNEVVY